ncbi:MAG: molybdopterin-guanine dinucleotide biosynthesis protein B [Candidatus Hydrogenedentes bacterium]|nr:molybdopterin-guanine dinucleotide biosynthesis protein B [Candidatus Hydrogenedentota bacterium]
MNLPHHWPVVGICGCSGSGKTTLIEQLVPRLLRDGLAVAVIKHNTHPFDVDHTRKDNARFFKAGATVFSHEIDQRSIRLASRDDLALFHACESMLREHDLVIVEELSASVLPAKLRLRSAKENHPPLHSQAPRAELGWNEDRVSVAHALISKLIRESMKAVPLHAGILLGGRSTRMGRPKHLMRLDDKTWLERQVAILASEVNSVCLLGEGELPGALSGHVQLPDAPGKRGPIAGITSAMRWDPRADWLFLACDMPLVTCEAVRWLLEQRIPGRWAVMPQRRESGQIEPLFAWYDHRLMAAIESVDRPISLAAHTKTALVAVPEEYDLQWVNLNTPDSLYEFDLCCRDAKIKQPD